MVEMTDDLEAEKQKSVSLTNGGLGAMAISPQKISSHELEHMSTGKKPPRGPQQPRNRGWQAKAAAPSSGSQHSEIVEESKGSKVDIQLTSNQSSVDLV